MANETDALPLLLNWSADNSKLLKSIDQIGARLDAAGIDLPKKAKKAAQGVEDAFGGLNRGALMELQHSARATFDALAAGASPMRILAMEGPRVAQALGSGQGGVVGALKGIAGFVNPVTVGLGAIGGLLIAGAVAGKQYVDRVGAIDNAIAGLGRASGATVGDVEAIAEAQAKAGTITEGAAEKIETALLTVGKVSADNLGAATTVVREFAQATHASLDAASKTLTKAFADPAKGAKELGEQYGLLNEAQVKQIEKLQEHGDSAAALKVLLQDLDKELKQSGGNLKDHAEGWDAVAKAVSGVWEAFGKGVANAVGLGSIDDRLKAALDKQQTNKALGFLDPDTDNQVVALQKQKDAQDALTRATAARAKANEASIAKAEQQRKLDEEARKAAEQRRQAEEKQRQAIERQELGIRAQMDAASKSGDTAEAQRLKDKLKLLELTKAYMQAGLGQTQAQAKAEAALGILQKGRAQAEAAATMDMQRQAELKAAAIAGDQATVDQLQREADLEALTLKYQAQNHTYEEAHALAMADLNKEQDAQNAKRAQAISDMHDQAALQAASLTGDQQTVELIQHRLDLERLILSYMDQHMTKAGAEKAAAEDLLKIDQARAQAKEQLLGQMQQEYALALATAKGDEAAVQALQQEARTAEMAKSLMGIVPGLDEASATDIATQAQATLRKASNTAANDFETLNRDLGDISSAFQSHDWGALTNAVAAAMNSLRSAFGPDGTLAGKIGAVAGLANQIGGMVGGKAGAAISGAAGGAEIGMTLGGPIGAALGGLGGLASALMGNDHTRDIQAQQAAQAALAQQAEATTAALQKLQQQQGDYNSALEGFYTASGQSQAALAQQRADQLKGLDAATSAIKTQTFAWDDYNTAVSSANDNVTAAQQALQAAYQAQAQTLQDQAAAVQALIDKYQQYQDSLRTLAASLDNSSGDGAMSLATARAAYASTLALAKTLDDNALQAFPQAAQDYIAAAKANAHTGAEAAMAVAQVKGDTAGLAALAGDQVSAQQTALTLGQQQLDTLKDQVSGLVQIDDSVKSVAAAIAALAAATSAKDSLTPPPASTGAGATRPGGDYTSTNGDFAAYVQGNADLLQGWRDGQKNPVFMKTITAAGLPATIAGWGQFQWEHGGASQGRAVRAFAQGGSFVLPGLEGVDRNLMSLNGHPLARVSKGEEVTIRPKALSLPEPGSDVTMQRMLTGIETLNARLAAVEKRTQRWDKGGMPVRAVDPSLPIEVAVA